MICPLYKSAFIAGMTSRYGDKSLMAVDEYVKVETKDPTITACDKDKCAAYRSYFHKGEKEIVGYCGLAGTERS